MTVIYTIKYMSSSWVVQKREYTRSTTTCKMHSSSNNAFQSTHNLKYKQWIVSSGSSQNGISYWPKARFVKLNLNLRLMEYTRQNIHSLASSQRRYSINFHSYVSIKRQKKGEESTAQKSISRNTVFLFYVFRFVIIASSSMCFFWFVFPFL